jgi:hypothetical protein
MREVKRRSRRLDIDAIRKERLALSVQGFAIGADDVLRPARLQIICRSAMRKQDRPKQAKPPCARLRIATTARSIGNRMAVLVADVCNRYIVARPGYSEMRRILSDMPSAVRWYVLFSDWSSACLASVPNMHTYAGCYPIQSVGRVRCRPRCLNQAQLFPQRHVKRSHWFPGLIGLAIHLPTSIQPKKPAGYTSGKLGEYAER